MGEEVGGRVCGTATGEKANVLSWRKETAWKTEAVMVV